MTVLAARECTSDTDDALTQACSTRLPTLGAAHHQHSSRPHRVRRGWHPLREERAPLPRARTARRAAAASRPRHLRRLHQLLLLKAPPPVLCVPHRRPITAVCALPHPAAHLAARLPPVVQPQLARCQHARVTAATSRRPRHRARARHTARRRRMPPACSAQGLRKRATSDAPVRRQKVTLCTPVHAPKLLSFLALCVPPAVPGGAPHVSACARRTHTD